LPRSLSKPLATGPEGTRNLEVRIWNSSTVVGAARSGDEARSGGIGFGLLVHGLPGERRPFGVERPVLDDLAAVEARVLGLGDEEAAAAARRGRAAADARRPRGARRAADTRGALPAGRHPSRARWPDGTMVEGVVDLAFEEGRALDRRRLQDRSRDCGRAARIATGRPGRAVRVGDSRRPPVNLLTAC